jgi:hypothetical protein
MFKLPAIPQLPRDFWMSEAAVDYRMGLAEDHPLLVRDVMRIGVPTCRLGGTFASVTASIVMQAPGRAILKDWPHRDGRLAYLMLSAAKVPKVLVAF